MTPDEAIKEQEDALADKWCPWSSELKASIRLGNEALKHFKHLYYQANGKYWKLLPGQTEEEG